MTDRRVTRRQALRYLAALGVLPLHSLIGCSVETDPSKLATLRRDRFSAALLGRAWLDDQSPEPDATELLARICGESGCADFNDNDRMRRLIAERHRSDFERGNLVSVDGWLMSETEVALYALVAIGD